MNIYPEFAKILITWYKENKRDLPWRNTTDPYKIWVSEIILQQTRVVQGVSYYERFIDAFPDVKSLAEAPLDQVLRLWQGLGYYSRARNMHATACAILEKYNLEFPSTYAELLHLKGVGEYTAAAISSFAFNEKKAVLDGNVYRVLSRLYGVSSDISESSTKKIFIELSEKNLPKDNCSEYNQAIMEFGALQCLPQNPRCNTCPLTMYCFAFQKNMQSQLPVKTNRVKVKKRYFTYLIYRYNDGIYLKKRGDSDIWGGLFEFLLEESPRQLKVETVMKRNEVFLSQQSSNSNLEIRKRDSIMKHILSHQHLFIQFVEIDINTPLENVDSLKWYSVQEIKELPKPIVIHNYLAKHIF